jgi:hypothetical protein
LVSDPRLTSRWPEEAKACARTWRNERLSQGRLKENFVPSHIDDPEHWRKCAEEMRALADEMQDEKSKQTMLRIAADYERLAERAEEQAKRPP